MAALLAAHRRELLRFLAARCGDAAEAEDLLQDLWLKVSGLQADGQAGSQASGPIVHPRAYLFRMANNLVLDRRRASQRAMRRDRQWLGEAEGGGGGGDMLPEHRPDPAPRADEELARQQEADLLRRAIDALPPGAARALRLHRLEGHPQGEVAEIMGISRSGVEKHLAVAMKHLRNTLADCGFHPAGASGKQGQSGASQHQADSQP